MLPGNIERDHQLMEEVLTDLIALLQKQDVNWAFDLLDLFATQLGVHIRTENVCLFPTILNAPREAFSSGEGLPSFEEVKSTIDKLRADHTFFVDQVSAAMRRIRGLMPQIDTNPSTFEAPLDEIRTAMAAVMERMQEHTQIEENQVYRWPELILPSDQYELLITVLASEVEKMPRRVERLA
jgi:hemerythrin-like domain-containing protein